MGRRLEYEVKTSVRLNMSNPQHVKINDVIQNLDPKIFKSKNQFIIDAIQFYIDNYGKETFVIKKKEKERAEYIRSEDIDDIKEEVIEAATNEARKEVIRLLGGVISGMNVGQPVIMQAANSAGDVVAESLTTGTDGQVVLSDLHLGTYVVTEIKSIDGYTINTTPQTVAVEYKDQTVTVQYESATIENTRQKADVSVVKKDSDTENPLDGGKYTLYAGNDIKNYAGQVIVTKGTALETVTTGEDGKASYSVDLPISNGYYISETQAPYAYISINN